MAKVNPPTISRATVKARQHAQAPHTMHHPLPIPTAAAATRAVYRRADLPMVAVAHAMLGVARWRLGRWARVCTGLAITLSAAAEPAIYLLGEVHDNPEGHALRFERIAHIVHSAPLPVIAMEQFDREKQALLDAAMRECSDAACVIGRAGGSGWDWPLYRPVIDLALRQHVPLVAANVSAHEARQVVRNGLAAALDAAVLTEFGLAAGIPPALDALQREAVFQGHCQMVPKSALGGMVQAQVARDVWMAHVVRTQLQKGATVLLLAGNGHVRKDAGVYQWLTAMERQRTQVHAYLESPQTGDEAAFDQVHAVASVQREDPCAAFAAPASGRATP